MKEKAPRPWRTHKLNTSSWLPLLWATGLQAFIVQVRRQAAPLTVLPKE